MVFSLSFLYEEPKLFIVTNMQKVEEIRRCEHALLQPLHTVKYINTAIIQTC